MPVNLLQFLPSFVGGMLALLTALALFALERAAARRERTRARRSAAVDRFIELTEHAATILIGEEKAHRWRLYELNARFAAHMPGQDRYVAEWATAVILGTAWSVGGSLKQLNRTLRGESHDTDFDTASADVQEAEKRAIDDLNLALSTLVLWSQGARKTRWFREQVQKHLR